MLILRGLSLFCLVSSGRCPEHLVEMEGFEPSSKRGINKLSTCLVVDLVFDLQQAQDNQLPTYILCFKNASDLCILYFRISLHHIIQTSRNGAMV